MTSARTPDSTAPQAVGQSPAGPVAGAPDAEPSPPAAVSWNAVLTTYVPALVLALGAAIALPALPTLAQSFGVSFGVASGVVTAFLLGNLAGTLPSGWLIDRFGLRPIMIAGPLLTAGTALLVAGTESFASLLVLRFINGCAAQMWLMARLAALSQSAAPDQRGRQVSWMFGMDNTGKLAGPVVGGFIASAWGMRAPFLAYAVFALLSLLPTLFFSREATQAAGKPVRAATKEKQPRLPMREIVMPRLAYFGVALFAGLTRGPMQADLLHLYAAFAYKLDPRQIGYLATGAAALTWPIGFIAGWAMDRYGRKRTMVPGFTGVALAMSALGGVAFLQLGLAWYVVFFLLSVALLAMTSGSIQTVGADVAPTGGRGTFLGMWRFTGQAGATVSPIAFALLADQVNYGSSFLFMALGAAATAFLLIRYVPETKAG